MTITKIIFPLIVVWSLVAVILHCSGVGLFAQWPVTALPWHWSCLCILWWDLLVALFCIVVSVICRWYLSKY